MICLYFCINLNSIAMNFKLKLSLFFSCFLVFGSFGQNAQTITPKGAELKQFYLNQNVEHLWLAGQHVDWETGQPDDPFATKGIKTHCSAFVASVCKQKHIYILRPPEHKTGLLASAQYEWLFSKEAAQIGWHQITDSIYQKAQTLANEGYLVTAVYKNPDPTRPGHIALVMPDEVTDDLLNQQGPTLIQAGSVNKSAIPLKLGFKHHIDNWEEATNTIKFFYNSNSQSAP